MSERQNSLQFLLQEAYAGVIFGQFMRAQARSPLILVTVGDLPKSASSPDLELLIFNYCNLPPKDEIFVIAHGTVLTGESTLPCQENVATGCELQHAPYSPGSMLAGTVNSAAHVFGTCEDLNKDPKIAWSKSCTSPNA